MANEAVLWLQTELPIPFTCANATGIEKGCLLKLSDPMTVAAHAAANDVVGGIAAEEKIASNGVTKIAVYRRGIFKVVASGSINVGDCLCLAHADWLNRVYSAKYLASVSGSIIIGHALETAATGETFLMELNICPYYA